MSSHLGILQQAGLVQSVRQGRSVIYAVDLTGVRDLLAFLLEDCCQGRAEVCAPLLDAVLPDCCGGLPAGKAQSAGN
jgi:DNA-binding transcriptional ArsR family regulator